MITDLKSLFLLELRISYDGAKRFTKALPMMVKATDSRELSQALAEHLERTRDQVRRLESVFAEWNLKPAVTPCGGMKGLMEASEHVISTGGPGPTLDVAIFGSVFRATHYNIAAYITLLLLADAAQSPETVLDLIETSLKEEEKASAFFEETISALIEEIEEGRERAPGE